LPTEPSGASARRRAPTALVAVLLALAALVAVPAVHPDSTADAASRRPLAVIVVGPVEGTTAYYKRDARRIASQLRSLGARVREIYSPYATWSRVRDAARGANLFVYLGHGNGYPSPYGSFNPRKMNGLGLNASAGRGNWNVRYYGEHYVRRYLDLAPGAVVILNHVCYAAGSSEPGRGYPSRRVATKRADNFAAGFLDAGAAVVFASDRSVKTIVRDLFGPSRAMRSVFWRSPWTSSRYDSRFASRRTDDAAGILAPYRPGAHYQSVVGDLGWTTREWRATWDPPAAVEPPSAEPSPTPTPDPALDPAVEPSPTPTPTWEPAPTPTPGPEPTTSPNPTPTPLPNPTSSPEPTPSPDPAP
jgi:hypothetical protein